MSDTATTDAATAAAYYAAALALVKVDMLTPIVIASFISSCLCRVVLALSGSYFFRFGSSDREKTTYKALVGFLTVLALVDTFVTDAWVFESAVDGFGDLVELTEWPISLVIYAFITGIAIASCQAFFVYRIYVISGKRLSPLICLLTALTLGGMICAFVMGSWATKAVSLTQFSEIAPVCWAWLGTELVCDFLLTGSLVYYLYYQPRRDGAAVSAVLASSPLNKIITLAAETNLASLTLQSTVVALIGYSLKINSLHYCIPGYQESKIYIASVLVTLNARTSILPSSSSNPSNSISLVDRSKKSRQGTRHSAASAGSIQVVVERDVHVSSDREGEEGHEVLAASGGRSMGRYYGGVRNVEFGGAEDGQSLSEKGGVRGMY